MPDLAPRPTAPSATATLTRYRAAVDYLESFITGNTEPPADRDAAGKARMATMAALLDALGNPQRAFRSVHVTGTSGKGSTSTLIASVLQAAGIRTGLHTTPYLQEPVEKVLVDGCPVSPGALADGVETLRDALAGQPALAAQVSFVQLWTALTFLLFARAGVEMAVVEASLGGRYDATNVLQPEVAVITNVGHDHLSVLGPTLADVAYHKAGIIKAGTPTVTACDGPDTLPIIVRTADEQAATLWVLGRDLELTVRRVDQAGCGLDLATPTGTYRNLHIGMLGRHQAVNAATAVATIEWLRRRGVDVPDRALRDGLAAARFPGRFEVVQRDPLVLLDGAHNREKAQSLRAALDEVFPNRPITFLLGVGASKEAAEVVDALLPVAGHIVCTEAPVIAKAAVPAHRLASLVHERGVSVAVEPDPQAAVEAAIQRATRDGLVCVTGSLYLVGAVRARWHPPAALLEADALASRAGTAC